MTLYEIADPSDPNGLETRETVVHALNQLPPRYRQVVELKFLSGLTFVEIGEVLQKPQGTVATWYRRAMQRLPSTKTTRPEPRCSPSSAGNFDTPADLTVLRRCLVPRHISRDDPLPYGSLKMWKRILKFTVLGVVILLIVAAGLRWWSLAQLERRLTHLREAGEPVSLPDLAPEPVPPPNNAATYLARVGDDAAKLSAELNPILRREDFNLREGLTQEELAAAEEAFQAYPQVMPALEKAANAKSHAWPLNYAQSHTEFLEDYFDVVEKWRTFARLSDCRGRYLAATGKPDDGVEVYLQQLRLARLQSREPLCTALLANVAIRQVGLEGINNILQTASLNPETYAAIEKELARHDSLNSFVEMLKTERVYGIESFGQFPHVLAFQWIEYLDYMEDQIKIGTRPTSAMEDPHSRSYGTLTALVAPSVEQSRNAMNRVCGLTRGVRIVNALIAQDVEDPAIDLATLGLPPETLVNPFSGEPLKHKKTDLGWTVGSEDINDHRTINMAAEPPPAVSP